MGEVWGVVSMTAIASSATAASVDALAEPIGAPCEWVVDIGARVHLAFVSATAIADLVTARGIARDAGRPNGGIAD